MQDKYVGDVGDFGKYLLLLSICSPDESDKKPLQLGINWYKVECGVENDEKDGKYINYLINDNFNLKQCCSPYSQELYIKLDEEVLFRNLKPEIKQKLKIIRGAQWGIECKEELKQISENRKVEEIQNAEILPENTKFYEKSLSYNSDRNHRNHWVAKGFERLNECDAIFFDPDNGLKDDDNFNNNIKNIYYSELDEYYESGKSLIIYHHATRKKGGLKEEAKDIMNKLNDRFNKNSNIRALWYHRGTARLFFIVANGNHKNKVNQRIDKFLKHFENKSKKEKHFEEIKDC